MIKMLIIKSTASNVETYRTKKIDIEIPRIRSLCISSKFWQILPKRIIPKAARNLTHKATVQINSF